MPIQKNTGVLKKDRKLPFATMVPYATTTPCKMYLQLYTHTNRHAVGNSGLSLNTQHTQLLHILLPGELFIPSPSAMPLSLPCS